ncbi:hypothetical protein [Helicobacter pylori]|uniref:hypothetical protein n=1 Tax=Helicobacter pylori TaxID=210 RepID=UPI002159CB77|nr:hypothetical protein [Helicobacter pylori]
MLWLCIRRLSFLAVSFNSALVLIKMRCFSSSVSVHSLKSYRFITKLFSLIVKNAFSVLDFYSFILLVVAFCFFCF